MSISKKHFDTLAANLRRVVIKYPEGTVERLAIEDCVHAVADACQAHNASFQRSRFLDACGLIKKSES